MNYAHPESRVTFDTLMLDRLRVQVEETISHEMAETLELQSWAEATMDRLVIALRATVLAEKLAEQTVDVAFSRNVDFHFPASPWQFFKANHEGTRWLGWFVRRWPVKTHRHSVYVYQKKAVAVQQFALFPMSPIRTPEKYRGPEVVRYESISLD